MIIYNLDLANIGPFRQAHLDFVDADNPTELPTVTIITGENGTGKSIIIDAIRGVLGGPQANLERDIVANKDFSISSEISFRGGKEQIVATRNTLSKTTKSFLTNIPELNSKFGSPAKNTSDWIVNFWTSKLSTDPFEIKQIISPRTNNYLVNALSGIHKNIEVTQLICFFDYLKGSDDKNEQQIGNRLFEILKQIIELSLNNGKLSHISRTKLQPIIEQNGKEITLDKLSSGNLYLMQRFSFVLKQMYSVCVNNNIPIEEIQNIKGVLLIDEAENHLHPKWQKLFLRNITKVFPQLQLILTTHSPFIVSSIENCRVYVCESKDDYSIVSDQTDIYSNKPIEEILLSPLFNTNSFNYDISQLIVQRKKYIADGDKVKAKKIEKELLKINPQYFDYLKVDEILKTLAKKK